MQAGSTLLIATRSSHSSGGFPALSGSGKCERSAVQLLTPGKYSTVKLYSSRCVVHLAILLVACSDPLVEKDITNG